jgi:hypothetical protein
MAWTIDDALNDKSIERTEKTASGYSFWLKGVPTEIQVVLSVNPAKGGFNYHLSHVIKTPDQYGTHSPSVPWGDYEAYALRLAVSAITQPYNFALKQGHEPASDWLIENPVRI